MRKNYDKNDKAVYKTSVIYSIVIQGRLSDPSSHGLWYMTHFIQICAAVAVFFLSQSPTPPHHAKSRVNLPYYKFVSLFLYWEEAEAVNHDNFISIRIFRNSHTTCNLGRLCCSGGV